MMKNLTAKENYLNLIEAVSQSYPQCKIAVSFSCADDLFLVEPYDLLMYRLLKELLTNVYKHSQAEHAWVELAQERGIITLQVSDDGKGTPDELLMADKTRHKGFSALVERVNSMYGTAAVSSREPRGISVEITLPMKGELSYQYFVG